MFRMFGAAALIAAAMLGCGSDDGGGTGNGGTAEESPNLGDSTEKMVTAAEGGEVALAEAGVKLSIPAGALPEDTMITAEVISKADLKDADSLAGNVIELGPDGLKFETPVTLELEVDAKEIPENADVALAWYDEENEKWVDLEGSEMAGGKVTAQTTHFTVFAVRFVVREDGEVVQEAGQCSGEFKPCGGKVEGTWNIVSGCADVGKALGNAGGSCAGASLSFGVDITGDITIGGGMITGTLHVMSEVTQVMPKSCIGGECPQASDPDDFQFVDKGDTCEGTQSETEDTELNETYETADGVFVTDDSSEMTEYCVTGDTLVVNTVNEDGVTIRWTAKRK